MLSALVALMLVAAEPPWMSDAQVLADLKALKAPDAYNKGTWSRVYSDAQSRLPSHLFHHAKEPGFLKAIAEVIDVASHDSHLPTVILNTPAMKDDELRLGLLRELSTDLKPKLALLAMAEVLSRISNKDRQDLPDAVLPTLERLLPLPDAQFKQDGCAIPFSEVFRSPAIQLLSEHFASNHQFQDYLWRFLAKDPTYEKLRAHERTLRAYGGPRADELLVRALADPSQYVANMALLIVMDTERGSLYPLAARAAVSMGKAKFQLNYIEPRVALEKIARKDAAGIVGLMELYEAVRRYDYLSAVVHVVVANRTALTREHWKRLLQIMVTVDESVGGVSDIIGRADLKAAIAELRTVLASNTKPQVASFIARGLVRQPDELQHAVLAGLEQSPLETKLGVLGGLDGVAAGKLLSQALTPLLKDANPEVRGATERILDPETHPRIHPRY
jgi:hypothetical protein